MAGETIKETGGGGYGTWGEAAGVQSLEEERKAWTVDEINSLLDEDFREAQRCYAKDRAFRQVADAQIEKAFEYGDVTKGIYEKVILGDVGLAEIRDNPDYHFFSQDAEKRDGAREGVLYAKTKMLRKEYPLGHVTSGDRPFDDNERSSHEQREAELKYGRFAIDYLKLSGYPEEITGSMVAAFYGAASDRSPGRKFSDGTAGEDKRFLSEKKLSKRLLEMSWLAGEIGAEGVKALHDECGIINYSNYDRSELIDQWRWLRGDDEVAKNYEDANNPVYARITDGIGDYNGAFSDDDGLGRGRRRLFFEVGLETERDLEKIGDLLRSRQPFVSTLEIGGHGGASGHDIAFGGATLSSKKYEEGASNSSLAWEDPVMTRILGTLQPDKKDTVTVIVRSCSQGKEKGGLAEVAAGVTHGMQQQPRTEVRVYAIDNPGFIESSIPGTIEARGSDTSLIGVRVTRDTSNRRVAQREKYGRDEKAVYDSSLHDDYIAELVDETIREEGAPIVYFDQNRRQYHDAEAICRAIISGGLCGYRFTKKRIPVNELGKPDRPREKGGENGEVSS